MELLTQISRYCERKNPGFFAEPLNFFSNLGFFIAAFLLLKSCREIPRLKKPRGTNLLIFEIFAIGVGSGFYHSVPQFWTKLTDIIPICMFLVTALWLFLQNILHWNTRGSILGVLVFTVVSIGIAKVSDHTKVNGSEFYFGSVAVLACMASYYGGRPLKVAATTVWMAALALTTSLVMRSVDLSTCTITGVGTHFLWHLLNSYVVYAVAKSYVIATTEIVAD